MQMENINVGSSLRPLVPFELTHPHIARARKQRRDRKKQEKEEKMRILQERKFNLQRFKDVMQRPALELRASKRASKQHKHPKSTTHKPAPHHKPKRPSIRPNTSVSHSRPSVRSSSSSSSLSNTARPMTSSSFKPVRPQKNQHNPSNNNLTPEQNANLAFAQSLLKASKSNPSSHTGERRKSAQSARSSSSRQRSSQPRSKRTTMNKNNTKIITTDTSEPILPSTFDAFASLFHNDDNNKLKLDKEPRPLVKHEVPPPDVRTLERDLDLDRWARKMEEINKRTRDLTSENIVTRTNHIYIERPSTELTARQINYDTFSAYIKKYGWGQRRKSKIRRKRVDNNNNGNDNSKIVVKNEAGDSEIVPEHANLQAFIYAIRDRPSKQQKDEEDEISKGSSTRPCSALKYNGHKLIYSRSKLTSSQIQKDKNSKRLMNRYIDEIEKVCT